jgi:hypothetical protein
VLTHIDHGTRAFCRKAVAKVKASKKELDIFKEEYES